MRVNKKICVVVLFVFTCITAILGMAACENGEIPPAISSHTHTYTETVSEKYLKSSATCTQKAVYYKSCSCGEKGAETFEHGDVLGHSYTNYTYNNDATCEKNGTETATCDNGCQNTDTRTKEKSTLGHNYGEWVSNENGTHTKTCSHDSTHKVTEDCHGGMATCTDKATCVDCSAKYGKTLSHNYSSEWVKNKSEHYRECVCGDKIAVSKHTPSAEATETTAQVCTVCGYVINPALGHVHKLHLTKVNAKAAKCVEAGNIEYYTCECGTWFKDENATTEITDKAV